MYVCNYLFYLLQINVMRECCKEFGTLKAILPIVLVTPLWNRWKLFEIATSYDLYLKKSFSEINHKLYKWLFNFHINFNKYCELVPVNLIIICNDYLNDGVDSNNLFPPFLAYLYSSKNAVIFF